MPVEYIRIPVLCSVETMSETKAMIIDDQLKKGFTYCDDQSDMDPYYCNLSLGFKREVPELQYEVEV